MKKLLLLSLLVMGATSFAQISGQTNIKTMPNTAVMGITLEGHVRTNTSSDLLLEVTSNGNSNGSGMKFDFGDIIAGSSVKGQTATFTLRRGDDSPILSTGKKSIEMGFYVTGGSEKTLKSTVTTHKVSGLDQAAAGTDKKVHIVYSYSQKTQQDGSVNGSITANVNVEKDAKAGLFIDNTVNFLAHVK